MTDDARREIPPITVTLFASGQPFQIRASYEPDWTRFDYLTDDPPVYGWRANAGPIALMSATSVLGTDFYDDATSALSAGFVSILERYGVVPMEPDVFEVLTITVEGPPAAGPTNERNEQRAPFWYCMFVDGLWHFAPAQQYASPCGLDPDAAGMVFTGSTPPDRPSHQICPTCRKAAAS